MDSQMLDIKKEEEQETTQFTCQECGETTTVTAAEKAQNKAQCKHCKYVVEVVYICGSCGVDNKMRPKETKKVIRCEHCGYRILYKKRTKRVIQFEAR